MAITADLARPGRDISRAQWVLIPFAICSVLLWATDAGAQTAATENVEIAVTMPLTGDGALSFGRGTLEGIQLAVEEANAGGAGPHIELKVYDDKGDDDVAREIAGKIVASRAMLVIGPSYSTASLAAGPIYAKAGLASLCPTATSDAITENATTFRMLFKNSQQGGTLATYLFRVLGRHEADVITVDNKYGQTLQTGFEETAQRLGIDARYFVFKTAEEADTIARRLGGEASARPIVFLTLDGDAARMLPTLRRLGAHGPVLGGDALGDESFSELFAGLPEEQRQPGYFTEGLYGITPMILDSANAETLAFAARYRARFGRDAIWMAVAGYDAARMAIAALQAMPAGAGANLDLGKPRAAVVSYLGSLNSVAQALPGLLGSLWFDADRGGQKAIRIGRFSRARIESAPLQIVQVPSASAAEIASGAVFEVDKGHYARLQRVVYTGVFLNEVPRVDIAQSRFTADFYLWVRFARDAGKDAADPAEINFPDLVRGSSDGKVPAAQGDLDDGTTYRLWRVRGDFNNDFDLHHYPADRQTLAIRFFNANAASDRLVYVQDRRNAGGLGPAAAVVTTSSTGGAALAGTSAAAARQADPFGSAVAPDAFRNLTQWEALRAGQRRDILVTQSALGDLRLVGVERMRELSGFNLTVELRRRVITTLAKTLLPLGLMALIMFASLYFPTALVKEKVTVAITGALSGAVLLSAINSQLGNVGYVIAVEYGFYLFFTLCLLCIVAVLAAERLRVAGRQSTAVAVEQSGRTLFILGFFGTILAGWIAYLRW